MFKVLLFSAIVIAASVSSAQSESAPVQKKHLHGLATTTMGFDDKKGKIELHVNAEAIYGFEHEATSKKDKTRKEKGLAKLEEKIADMIVFDKSLNCEIKKEIFEVNQERRSHAEVIAEFSVTCAAPVAGTNVEFNFQKAFPRIKTVQVDVIVDSVQKSAEITKNGESLELK